MHTHTVRDRARRLRQRLRRYILRPAILGTLRRTRPLSDDFGYDRGNPVDRYYIERFLAQHRSHITGRVLEVKEPIYTERFGDRVTRSDVLDLDASNPRATFVADLAADDGLPADTFNCFILTQTLQVHLSSRCGDSTGASRASTRWCAAGHGARRQPRRVSTRSRTGLLALHKRRLFQDCSVRRSGQPKSQFERMAMF